MHELDLSTFIFLVRAVAVASRAHSVTQVYFKFYRRVKEITGYSGVATYIGHHPVCIQTLLKLFATQDMAWQYHRKGSDCNSVTR